MEEKFHVTMLGGFSIRLGDRTIGDGNNRMRKVWLLLAYMIYSRSTRASQEQLLSLIQGADSAEIDDPANRLKALLFRTRSVLDGLGAGTGHRMIVRGNGSYCWNTEAPLTLDVEEFDRLCTAASAAQEESALELYLQALELYRGDFLPKLSMEPWAMPINAYYHRMYLDGVQKTLRLLQERSRWEEASQLCSQALKIEPYSEELYQHKMRCCLACADRAGAVSLYEQMSELLFDTFGVMPSDESRAIYREATREVGNHMVPIDTVREQLREDESNKGAIYCEYDFFRFLYQVQARAIVRSGQVIHIALLSVHGEDRQPLSRRSLDRAVDNLRELMLSNLRQGDVISRCTVSQLVMMLPQANYENSCAVCQRIIKAFRKKYPHSPADIHFSVQPLSPKGL